MNLIDAARQALKALEEFDKGRRNHGMLWQERHITALRAAIEQAEKAEPVAWWDSEANDVSLENVDGTLVPLYTNPSFAAAPEAPK